MRFLTTYVSDLSSNRHVNNLTTSLVDLIAFSLSAGDTFLPDPASYDDLFYKIVETGPIIARFRDVYKLIPASHTPTPSTEAPKVSLSSDAAANIADIDTLMSVSTHFRSLLFQTDSQRPTSPTTSTTNGVGADTPASPSVIPAARKKNLLPREVHQIIKQGYETLSIQTREGLNNWEKWRETDWKLELKRVGRFAVEDARKLVL
jgi:hypothetical protein